MFYTNILRVKVTKFACLGESTYFLTIMSEDSRNMHGKSLNMRIYMHIKSPKYAPKYAKFAEIRININYRRKVRNMKHMH